MVGYLLLCEDPFCLDICCRSEHARRFECTRCRCDRFEYRADRCRLGWRVCRRNFWLLLVSQIALEQRLILSQHAVPPKGAVKTTAARFAHRTHCGVIGEQRRDMQIAVGFVREEACVGAGYPTVELILMSDNGGTGSQRFHE